MKGIKIAHIAHSVGGVDVYLRLILDNIDNNRFSSIVIHGSHDTNQLFLDSNKNEVQSYRTSIKRDISLVEDLQAIIATCKILKKMKEVSPNN